MIAHNDSRWVLIIRVPALARRALSIGYIFPASQFIAHHISSSSDLTWHHHHSLLEISPASLMLSNGGIGATVREKWGGTGWLEME